MAEKLARTGLIHKDPTGFSKCFVVSAFTLAAGIRLA